MRKGKDSVKGKGKGKGSAEGKEHNKGGGSSASTVVEGKGWQPSSPYTVVDGWGGKPGHDMREWPLLSVGAQGGTPAPAGRASHSQWWAQAPAPQALVPPPWRQASDLIPRSPSPMFVQWPRGQAIASPAIEWNGWSSPGHGWGWSGDGHGQSWPPERLDGGLGG
jgi:hypothetical protein